MRLAYIGIFLLVVVLLLLFVGVFAINIVVAPETHKAIVKNTEIIDTAASFRLSAKLVDSGSKKWAEGLETLPIFVKNQPYPQSTWLWQRYGDTEFVMTIWGPGTDGKTHFVEFGRVGGNAFLIKINGETKFSISANTETTTAPAEGYYWLTLEVT